VALETTGERFIPETMGGQLIEAEHVVRYALAAQLAPGRRVLDAGCGVGWGTEMLLTAGAASATGLDLSDGAIADARRRVPDAQFVQGNLRQLPWDDGAFDLVVCFEALEHVDAQEQTLDELVRVLASDGFLLVSSPNPRVYPPGNPFHLHEFTPEELVEAIEGRLSSVALWNQHSQIASILVQKGRLSVGETHTVLARAVSPLEAGSDPYSLVIAGRASLPSLPPVLGFAPSDQLLHLEAASALLFEERERLSDDQTRVREEREWILAERSKMILEIDQLRRERERIGLLLLESEQELAVARAAAPLQVWTSEQEQIVGMLTAQVADLQHESARLQQSTSWRVTAPLRALSRLRSRDR
jgi:2-polyprenyl-3-methyl-5-hydroxy-6-metoxy-1,4-benzoquinol methylase